MLPNEGVRPPQFAPKLNKSFNLVRNRQKSYEVHWSHFGAWDKVFRIQGECEELVTRSRRAQYENVERKWSEPKMRAHRRYAQLRGVSIFDKFRVVSLYAV